MKTKITLKGRIPSKKNSKVMICKGTRPMLISSKKHKEWWEDQMWELKKYYRVEDVESIEITFYAPDKRKADKTNKAESIMDLLVDSDIIEDDNWYVFNTLILKFGGVDKENPRAEIIINGK